MSSKSHYLTLTAIDRAKNPFNMMQLFNCRIICCIIIVCEEIWKIINNVNMCQISISSICNGDSEGNISTNSCSDTIHPTRATCIPDFFNKMNIRHGSLFSYHMNCILITYSFRCGNISNIIIFPGNINMSSKRYFFVTTYWYRRKYPFDMMQLFNCRIIC